MPKPGRHTNNPLSGAKKAAPSAQMCPYMVQEKWGEPVYFKTFDLAKKNVISRLQGLADSWRAINAMDAVEACEALIKQANDLPVDGGTVAGVVDPYSGMKCSIQLILRDPV